MRAFAKQQLGCFRLPGTVHNIQDFVVSLRRIDPSGLKLMGANPPAECDHGLVDDHGFAVHRRMASETAVP